jgi:Tol biopolymer transport system component
MKWRLLLLASAAAFAQAPASWTPELAMQVKTIGEVVPSPDGTRAAWTETRAILEPERSEALTQIFLANVDGSHRIQLTRGEKSSTDPAFSPDGRYLYFVSARSGKRNVYRVEIAGGEAEMLTSFKGDLGAFRLSPDGKTVAFTGHEPAPDDEKKTKEKRDWKVVDADPPNHALYIVPAEPGADGKRAHKKLTDGKRHVTDFDWSPDSRSIAFTDQPTPLADDWTRADVSELDIN